ncbi:hypothetical protein Rt10032_c07g3194 [Rhodotorula toruloides]|uniref:Uncharacterized protein n=1 Tax=Rhodotorula toruloides TaxID=5286 RepID=A0A511KFM8_RHOTO|nr:hypothetical protein Rt10032_c07g3194 [Rhodotorula toruloides]
MPQRSPYHGRRIRGIELPCPSCIPLSTKAASVIACVVICVAYVVWSVVLWKGYSFIVDLKNMSSNTAFDELSLMARYTSFSTYFTITLSLLCLGALVISIFPQPETAKWLSRMIWVGWLATWGFGVFGICAYLSADSFVKAGCRMDQECWTYREKLRVGVILSVFATLAVVFYCSIILSSYVHTLHPHLFLSPDSDSEDDFSDPDEAAHLALEEELKRSGHFAARGALEDLKEELGRRREASKSVEEQELDGDD